MRTASVMRSLGSPLPSGAGRGLSSAGSYWRAARARRRAPRCRPRRGAAVRVGEDTFRVRHEIRARNPHARPLRELLLFLARGVRQFHEFARFEPALPRLDRAGYLERIGRVVARHPWGPPPPTRRSRDDPRLPQPVRVLPDQEAR